MACVFLSPLFFFFLKNMPTSEKPPTVFIINCLVKKIPGLLFLQKGEKKKKIKVGPMVRVNH